MKKHLLIPLCLFLVSCQSTTIDSFNSSDTPTSSENESIESSNEVSSDNDSSVESEGSVEYSKEPSENSSIDSSSSEEHNSSIPNLSDNTIHSVLTIGEKLSEGELGNQVTFEGVYVKMVNFNFDHYMLFVDDTDYIYVYVNNSDYSKVSNKYLKYSYSVSGMVKKEKGRVIVNYETLQNLSSSEVTINYNTLAEKMESIANINEEASKIVLDETKYNGSGKVVSFDAQIIAFDESDANQKAIVYDGSQVMTIIDTKKIGSPSSDIGCTYTFVGAINVQSSHPAILLIDKTLKDSENKDIVIENDEEVSVGYFAKWNLNSDVMKVPTYEDYAKIYTSTVYIKDDESKTNAYYMGMVDSINNSLSDSGMGKRDVVKGAYLMNNLNITEYELTNYSPFYEYYVNEVPVTFSYVLFNFNNNDHIWRVMPLNFTIPEYN